MRRDQQPRSAARHAHALPQPLRRRCFPASAWGQAVPLQVHAMSPGEESEWKTRKRRIDPRLDAIGWKLGQGAASPTPNRTEEHETQNGPADYVLWHDRNIVGVVEAKKVTIGPQNVLTQAERYARGLGDTPFNFGGLRVPFLYSTSGEVTWFQDVRHPLNRTRRLAQFHTPNALAEMLGPGYVRLLQIRDFGDKPFPTYVPQTSRLKLAKAEDLLLARYGGGSASDTLGRICTGLEGAYNVALAKLVFSSDVVRRVGVRTYFEGPWFKRHVSRNSRSCQTGFNRDDIQDLEMLLPPLESQDRIVAAVDRLIPADSQRRRTI